MRQVARYSAGAPYSDLWKSRRCGNSLTAKDLFVRRHPLDTNGNSPGLVSRWDPWVKLLLTYSLLSRFS